MEFTLGLKLGFFALFLFCLERKDLHFLPHSLFGLDRKDMHLRVGTVRGLLLLLKLQLGFDQGHFLLLFLFGLNRKDLHSGHWRPGCPEVEGDPGRGRGGPQSPLRVHQASVDPGPWGETPGAGHGDGGDSRKGGLTKHFAILLS